MPVQDKLAIYPSVQSGELKDLSVLFMHPSSEVCDTFEALAEQSLKRANFFTASTLSTGRDLLKIHGCQLAIFQDGIDGKDFVFTQLELRNNRSEINMIPLIDIPTIEQLSAQRKIGGIYTFGKKVDIASFSMVEAMILNFARDSERQNSSLREKLEYGKTLQGFLFAKDKDEHQIKAISRKLIDGLLVNYDLSPSECSCIVAAEMIYSPDLSSTSYSLLLVNDKHGLASWLTQTASWKIPDSKPTSAGGLAITLANYLAWGSVSGRNTNEIVGEVFNRPHFVLHPSIRALNPEEVAIALESITSTESSFLKAVGDAK